MSPRSTWRVVGVVVALLVLVGCASDEKDAETPVPVETLQGPMPTGVEGARRLARLVAKNLLANNPNSKKPIVSCSPFPEVADGVQVPCQVRFGVYGPANGLRVRFTDEIGNFQFGPGTPGA